MKIKFLSGPKSGEVRHAEKSQATQLLIDAGLVELVVDDKNEPRLPHTQDVVAPYFPEPIWSVGKHNISGVLLVTLKKGHETWLFDAPPTDQRWQCPLEVFQQWDLATGQETAKLVADGEIRRRVAIGDGSQRFNSEADVLRVIHRKQ